MKKYVAYYLCVIVALYGCSGNEEQQKKEIRVEGYAQGTTYSVVYVSEDGKNYQRAIDSMLIAIDNSLSTYQKRSIISKFNKADSIFEVDDLFIDVALASQQVYTNTTGAFDPTVASIVNAWGFGFEKKDEIDSLLIDSLLTYVGYDKVLINAKEKTVTKTNSALMLDFNAVAQGYTVDVLGDLLEQRGVNNYLVEVGGELKAKGTNFNDTLWRIGIDKPVEGLKEREIKAIIHLDNKALATSGNYRKFYEKDGKKYSHTIDPINGYPVQHNLLSATVVTENCAMADAYATAFMVMGLEKAKAFIAQQQNLEALFIYSDDNNIMQTYVTEGLNSYVELNTEKE